MNLSDRARELLEWLRRELWIANKCVAALAECQGYQTELLGRWKHTAALFKSRAETLESLLAENERLSGLLSCAATGLAIACEGGVSNGLLTQLWIDPHGLLSDITDALGHDPLCAPNGEPAVVPSSVSGQAEPESDPGSPAGSSTDQKETLE